jgi:signal transduction histidine kinase
MVRWILVWGSLAGACLFIGAAAAARPVQQAGVPSDEALRSFDAAIVARGFCRVAVADAGPGIPPAIREKIFTPFFSLPSRTAPASGFRRPKRLVEAHHGTIQIDCPPRGGTTVTVLLPLAGTPSGGALLESTQAGTHD